MSIIISDGVTSIEDKAFSCCKRFTRVISGRRETLKGGF